jgi:glycosyltransferase involved in cell wall biosynthesis
MNIPIRVLHVVVNMNRGGAETLIMNLYRNIDRSKVQFDFFTCKEGVFDTEIKEMGGKVHRIPYVTDVGHFAYIKALEAFFSSNKEYRIVHSHLDRMSGFVLRAAKKSGIPVRIAHSHNTKSEGGFVARAYKFYASQFISSSATNLMACSELASKWLFGRDSNRCHLVKNAIDLTKFTFSSSMRTDIRKSLGIDDNTLVIGHVGRFCHQKNHAFLIDIFEEFVKLNSNTVLLLVSNGSLMPDIEDKTASLGLSDKVKFLGVRSDVNCIMQAFDVFAFPSLHEGLPVTLIEAQGAGIPCIISDVISREVDMGIGLVEYLPINDKMVWVNKLNISVIRTLSGKTIEALREKGYDINSVSQGIQDFYTNISR